MANYLLQYFPNILKETRDCPTSSAKSASNSCLSDSRNRKGKQISFEFFLVDCTLAARLALVHYCRDIGLHSLNYWFFHQEKLVLRKAHIVKGFFTNTFVINLSNIFNFLLCILCAFNSDKFSVPVECKGSVQFSAVQCSSMHIIVVQDCAMQCSTM